VLAITYLSIDGLTYNLVQMLYSLRRSAVTLTLKVQGHMTYSTHNLNNFNKYPSITYSYIQECLVYKPTTCI